MPTPSYIIQPGETPEQQRLRRAEAERLLAEGSSGAPIQHWAQGLNRLAQGAAGGYSMFQAGEADRADAANTSDLLSSLLDPSAATASPGGGAGGGNMPVSGNPISNPAAGVPRPSPAAAGTVANILRAEGTGRNPNSSATGTGQFINSTWLDMIKRRRPDVAAGKTDPEILALRDDPALGPTLGAEMTGAYAEENGAKLAAAGLPATPAAISLAHFLGPAGAVKALKADPRTPVELIASPEAIRANPFMRNMNAGQLANWAATRGAPAGGEVAATDVPATGADPRRVKIAAALMRNPNSRAIGEKLLAGEIDRSTPKPDELENVYFNGKQYSVKRNPRTGKVRQLTPADIGMGGPAGTMPSDFEDTQKLRKELMAQPNVKKFDDAYGSYKSMLKSGRQDSPSADLDMIYGLAKILDPESVVREGEFATVRSSQAIPDQIRGYWQFLTEGKGKLTQEARQKVSEIAANRLNAYRDLAIQDSDRFSGYAKAQRVDPAQVSRQFGEIDPFIAAQGSPPAANAAIKIIRGSDGKLIRAQ